MPTETLDREVGSVMAPPAVLTPRFLEGFQALHQYPFRSHIIELLRSAEKEIFVPLLTLATPAAFGQQFEFLALRFAPIRITAACWLAMGIGPEFASNYLKATNEMRHWFVENSWGLPRPDLAATFDLYVKTARTLVSIGPKLATVPGRDFMEVLGSITEVDFGLTSLTLAFEREIKTDEWIIWETYGRTRRALLSYEQAVSVITAHVQESGEMEKVLTELRPDEGIEQPGEHDLRTTFHRYSR
jgi:hypothetical protein